MKILSITTATNHLNVALNDGDKIVEKMKRIIATIASI